MTTFRTLLIAVSAGLSLMAAAIPAAEARHRYAHYYGYGPAYTYAPYGAGYYRGRPYYGSVYGRRCDPELFGRITRYTCAYRNW